MENCLFMPVLAGLVGFLQVRGQAVDRLDDAASFHRHRFGNSSLVRLEVRRRRWLLPPLVRTSMPDPVRRKRLDVALWVLILYLPVVCLRGTIELLLSHKIPRIGLSSADVNNVNNLETDEISAVDYFFLLAFPGPSTINMVRPSKAGGCSTIAISDKYFGNLFQVWRAISGIRDLAPRNRIRTLTFIPSSNQRRASRDFQIRGGVHSSLDGGGFP